MLLLYRGTSVGTPVTSSVARAGVRLCLSLIVPCAAEMVVIPTGFDFYRTVNFLKISISNIPANDSIYRYN